MNARDLVQLLGEDVERLYRESEDPSSEPVTIRMLSEVFERVARRLDGENADLREA